MLQNQQCPQVDQDSLAPRLESIVHQVADVCGASYAFLLLYEPAPPEFRLAAWHGPEAASTGCTASWCVLRRAEPTYLCGKAGGREIVGCSLREEVLPAICAPVVSNAMHRGVLVVGCPIAKGERLSRWLPIVEIAAELAGALLEDVVIQTGLYRKEEQLRNLVRETLEAQEAERERICLEVHDGVTQTMATVFQYLQTIESISPKGTRGRQLLLRASALVQQAMQESRDIMDSLQSVTLRDLGLVAALRQELKDLQQETGWEVTFQSDVARLPKNVESGLYRIIREAVTNARKYSGTERLLVSLMCTGERVIAEVKDWGIGFDADFNSHRGASSERRAIGLLSMRKRAELLRGVCDIQSILGQGTTVRVDIPFSF